MIRDQPQGRELLIEARRVLIDTVLPGLPAETRYQVLMIARAVTLAERQFHASSRIEKILGEELQQILDQDGTVPELTRVLAKCIRDGGFDLSGDLYAFLQMIVAFKLKETNPSKIGEKLEDLLDQIPP